MSVANPQLWQSLQFGDKDSFVDFLGMHALWHFQVDQVIRRHGGPAFPSLPLGDGPMGDDQGDWHLIHQAVHDGETAGLNIAGSADFTAYDLNHRDDFHTWTWIHAEDCIRIMRAAGL